MKNLIAEVSELNLETRFNQKRLSYRSWRLTHSSVGSVLNFVGALSRPAPCCGSDPRLWKSTLSLIKPSQSSTDPTLLLKLARWRETYLLSATHAALCPSRKLDCKTNIWKWFYLICVYILSVILGLLCGIFSIKRVGVWPSGQTKGSQRFGWFGRIGSLLLAGPTPQEGIQVRDTARSRGAEKLPVAPFVWSARGRIGGLLISAHLTIIVMLDRHPIYASQPTAQPTT